MAEPRVFKREQGPNWRKLPGAEQRTCPGFCACRRKLQKCTEEVALAVSILCVYAVQ